MRLGDAEALRLAVGMLEERLRRLPAAGLRGAELFVLATVETLGPDAFPTAIGDRLGMRRSNVSATIKDLERRGYLEHVGEGDEADGRRRPVRPTDRGYEALHAQERERDHWLAGHGSEQLTAEEAAHLRDAVPLLLRLARAEPDAG
ncbi:Transcriptional regulator, MarR family OS=Tsukamurella paurometabola (strain ATCC 8368 / DSM/ CCUG 35730 / CIP 100753 / JCM 10117 / KCTC 9821 / NBRC 16120/ NCIMB 702349 / NCTC 13040) OX=521096 GN=Tpau_2286 PE=4 SV=1 [Tsukamurella paurometabola]|uniref:Transcriptional regulator, MarR family n=1 Tax=Tsukamurella paurometabola (strain ATCC 8368 / DSM 20162 / CCUG 35730 / CIP 100753 / JCM 10117 / KCTC 9821 / NBRC 16120 / NCIMB 702349 / NCTC 13040) TaxID=521096 RepID=D5UQC3_TSUPD|nr:MarR family transcriptional regulator [Tsukamurella paurometabola]ADG78893.1 transcriptional regulator, MarR family [Tsukamurella paurometabola DSM 20162]SUP33440.1 MarR family [Tsukamurella paurometabola]